MIRSIRLSVAVSAVVAGVLACSGVAAAASSTAGFAFNAGQLRLFTHTTYPNFNQRTSQISWKLDNALVFHPKAVPSCTAFTNWPSMAEAMADCGLALVGMGTASSSLSMPNDSPACLLVFNTGRGLAIWARVQLPTAQSPIGTINCSNPSTNYGGNASDVWSVVFSRNGPAQADYASGQTITAGRLDRAVQVNAVNLTIGSGRYVTKTCTRRDPWLNLQTSFKYTLNIPGEGSEPAGTQTVGSRHRC